MVAQSPELTGTVSGTALRDPAWVTARISEMGRDWGTGSCRAAGTLWWCMVASALVDPVVRAYAQQAAVPVVELEGITCPVRADGGVETVRLGEPGGGVRGRTASRPASAPDAGPVGAADAGPADAADAGLADASANPTPDPRARRAAAQALRASLTSVIATVAQASGTGIPALWAVVADAVGNRAIDAGAPGVAGELAHDVGGKLPAPRFHEVGGRTFVKRISCCLVFEAPGCAMCTSCPKRPAAEREQLLAALTTER